MNRLHYATKERGYLMIAKISGLVLEVHNKKGDKEGVEFNNLIVYEFNQPFPELRRIGLKREQVGFAKTFVGKMADIEVNVASFQGRTSLYFVSGTVNDKKAAA
jgi:hypothetical protein